MTSGRFTPAASTFTRISRAPGTGTGRSCGCKTSGPPGTVITMAVIRAGVEDIRSHQMRVETGLRLDGPAECDNGSRNSYDFQRKGMPEMAAHEDEERPKKKLVHEIGQDLALLSIEELGERIALLTSEIERLEAARTKKQASRSAADQFFKR